MTDNNKPEQAVPDDAVVTVPRALLEQVYGMAREGCEAPMAAWRWCERIDELFHSGQPSAEYADFASDLPAAIDDARKEGRSNG